MTDEIIRFGMSDYCNSKGFPIRDFKNFSKNIDINSIYAEFGGKDKIPEKMKNLIDSVFYKIADGNPYGKDGSVIEEKELIYYFKMLDKAAENGDLFQVDKETLDRSELYDMEAERGTVKKQQTFLGIPINIDKESLEYLGKFVKALVNANDKNYAKEQAEAKDLASRTTVDKNGNKIVKEKNGDITVYDKDNRLVKKQSVDKSGTSTDFYNDGHRTKHIDEDKTHKRTTTYDKEGNPLKEVYSSKTEKYTSTKEYVYGKDEKLAYKVENSNYSKSTTKYKDGLFPTKKTTVDKKDGIITEEFYKPESFDVYKKVNKDKDKNILSTTTYEYDKGGYVTKEVYIDAKNDNMNRTILHKHKKDGTPISEEEQDKHGKTLRLTEYSAKKNYERTRTIEYVGDDKFVTKYVKDLPIKTEKFNKNGTLVQTEESSYDTKGREIKYTKKDAKDTVLETATTTYAKNSWKTERHYNYGNLVDITTMVRNTNGHNEKTQTYRKSGTLLVEMETKYTKGVGTELIFKDSNGNVITEKEYMKYIKCNTER